MPEINYGIFCEDVAQSLFIDKVIPQIVDYLKKTGQISFNKSEEFRRTFETDNNRKKVKNNYIKALTQAFSRYNLDLCLVGFDLDNSSRDLFNNELNGIENNLEQYFISHNSKIIIFIPVQCIEHWLWYIKEHNENPGRTKRPVLEPKPNHEAKRMIYGRQRPGKELAKEIVSKLTDNMDIEWLKSRSFSFNSFFNKFKDYIDKLNV